MLRRIIFFAVHQPLFLFLILLLFIGAGVFALRTLPIEAFPDVTDIQVNVVTLYPGHAAEEVEKQVSIPLEIALSGLPHAVRVFSHTQFGLSSTYITFDDEADNYFARQQVLERFQTVDLPDGVHPDLAPLSTAIGEIYRIYLKSDNYDAIELRSLEDWVVERHLKLVPGVADVVSRGGHIKQYQVVPDLIRMKSRGVALKQMFEALERSNTNAGGGYIEQGQQQMIIRGIGLLRSPSDIGNVILAERGGVPVLIRDVAEVRTGYQQPQGLVGMDGRDDIVNGTILMRKGENPSVVLGGVKDKMNELNRSILPKGVEVVPYYDRADLISKTLTTVFENLLEGAVLVSLVLYLFLGNVRAAVIVAVVIPLALLGTFLGLKMRGIPANLLSLGAMDFGIIVDGAVIVVENIFRRIAHEHRAHGSFKDLVAEAAFQVGRPTFFSMLIIITAHIPIFTLQRHEGRIFAPMAWTVTSALVGSLFFALTLVPLLCYFLLRKNLPRQENLLVRLCKRLYRPALDWALDHRRLVLGSAIIALAASLAVAPKLGTEFLPELNEGTIWVNIALPAGISVSEASAQCARIRAALRQTPEIRTVISKAGRPEDGTDPKPINMVELFVDLIPPPQWRPRFTKEKIIEEMDHALAAFPGMETTFSQPIRDNVLESISQIDGQIVIKLFGEDSAVLRQQLQRVLNNIHDVPGVMRAFIDRAGEVPQSIIEIDRQRAARYGLNVSDIQDVIETGLGGRAATELWEEEKHFSVVLRLPEAERRMSNMERILVDTPEGLHIPLGPVANFKVSSGSMNISRENGTRVTAIGVFIKGRDMGSVVADMQERVKTLTLPPGYYLSWSGEFENQQRAMRRLSFIVPVSVFLIFILLFDAFKSVKSALLILLNVPFALIGGIFALLLTHIPLSVSAAIGFIALFGQAVLNGVVMVSCFNQLREAGATRLEAVRQGALVRMRTVLMTALLAMLGLWPMALSHGIGAETQKPLAVVIIGGLISATLLTLIVLPSLYLLFERNDKSGTSMVTKAEIGGESLDSAEV